MLGFKLLVIKISLNKVLRFHIKPNPRSDYNANLIFNKPKSRLLDAAENKLQRLVEWIMKYSPCSPNQRCIASNPNKSGNKRACQIFQLYSLRLFNMPPSYSVCLTLLILI